MKPTKLLHKKEYPSDLRSMHDILMYHVNKEAEILVEDHPLPPPSAPHQVQLKMTLPVIAAWSKEFVMGMMP